MESKILLCACDCAEIQNFKGEYDGIYLIYKGDLKVIDFTENKELFVDITEIDLNATLTLIQNLKDKCPTFVIDDISKAVLVKSFLKDAKISYRLNTFNKDLLPFLSVNGFGVSITYTTLAPERVDIFHKAGAKINGVFVKRFDELGVLKFYKTDYITILPEIK